MVLNIASPDTSDITFKISKYPDGQQSVTIQLFPLTATPTENITISTRLNNFLDLEILISATQALRELGYNDISLYVPYFLGARSDRKFEEGASNYLKTVICPIINSQNYSKVKVFDPHSDVLEACLNNFEKISSKYLALSAIADIVAKNPTKGITLISPDASALKRTYDVAEFLNIEKILVANKHREIKTGKITHTSVPGLEETAGQAYVLIDDICDGGMTFIKIAEVIKKRREISPIYLIVSHFIGSAGLEPLAKVFDGVYTTNSYRSFEPDTEFVAHNEKYMKKLTVTNLF